MMHGTERELQPGQVIAERYRIEAPIGRGAMGAVWRAVHVTLESPVAIKFLNAAIADDPSMLDRFMREAQSAAAVRSSHVVQIFDYGVDRGAPYIAMELLVGEPLDVRLDRGPLAPAELDKVFDEVARAVGVAHDLGVVHRDIKPANIFIAREGGRELTKVLDFGIAKLVDRRIEAPAGSGTHTGIILGTPNYMSPEQARGHRRVDHRSDLWSLAILAFECLTGRQPFESSSLGDLVVKICTAEPLVPSAVAAVPPAFDAWFARGAHKDPAARFHSAGEMAEALHALLAAEGLGADSRPRSTPARLELVSTEVIPAGAHGPRVAPVPSFPPVPHEPSERSMTAKAVSSEVLARPRPAALRRKLALAAIPLAALVIALAAAFVEAPTRPPAGAQALPAPSVAAALEPSMRAPGAAERKPPAPSTTKDEAAPPTPALVEEAPHSAALEPSQRATTAADAIDVAGHAATVAPSEAAKMNGASARSSAASGSAGRNTSAARAGTARIPRAIIAADASPAAHGRIVANGAAAARAAGRDSTPSPARSRNDAPATATAAPSVAPAPAVDPYADRL
jgi:serine/threonine protein kinase